MMVDGLSTIIAIFNNNTSTLGPIAGYIFPFFSWRDHKFLSNLVNIINKIFDLAINQESTLIANPFERTISFVLCRNITLTDIL